MGNGKIALDLRSVGDIVFAKWTVDDLPQGKVKIKRGDLKRNCSSIREQLNVLTEYVMDNPDICDNSETAREIDPDFKRYNEILRTLRSSGVTIFRYLVGDNKTLAERLRLAPLGAELQINFDDEDVMAPLGFVCDNRQHRNSQAPLIDDFEDFWMRKFTIVNFLSTVSVSADSISFKSRNFKALFAIDETQWSRSNVDLKNKRPDYLSLYDIRLGTKHSWDNIREAWCDMESSDGLVFFFCEADGISIKVNDDKLDANDVKEIFRTRKADCGKSILFLNTCLSAKGDSDDSTSLVSLLELPHFPCFIGTEAQVANNKALLCASHFMHSLCFDNATLGDALDSMRQDKSLFPTNLFYSLYGPREIALDQPLLKPTHGDCAPIGAGPLLAIAEGCHQ